jgi:hypothetical protein
MNTAQDRYQPPQMKASDADRDAVVAALSEHFQAGRLTSEELEERTGRALAARTLGQLDELTADLPAPRPAAPAGPAGPAAPPHRSGYLPMVPLVVPLAVLAIVALTLATSAGMHGWGIWWVIPVALLIVRRLAGARGIRRDFRRH